MRSNRVRIDSKSVTVCERLHLLLLLLQLLWLLVDQFAVETTLLVVPVSRGALATIFLILTYFELLIVMALSGVLSGRTHTTGPVLRPAARLCLVLTEVDWGAAGSRLLERAHVRLAEDGLAII